MKFLVSVEGRLVVTADNPQEARSTVEDTLTARQPWLRMAYGEPTRVEEIEDVSDISVIKVHETYYTGKEYN